MRSGNARSFAVASLIGFFRESLFRFLVVTIGILQTIALGFQVVVTLGMFSD